MKGNWLKNRSGFSCFAVTEGPDGTPVINFHHPCAGGGKAYGVMQILTDRLLIRPFEEGDLAQFEKLLDLPEVPGWQKQKEYSAGFLRWQIANYEAMDIRQGLVCFGIFEKKTGAILGAIGAGKHDDLDETEIFYNLLPVARGKGYATEAAKAVTAWVFENYNLSSLIGTVRVDNLPSQRVLERCGYELVEERELLVHIANEKHLYKIYKTCP